MDTNEITIDPEFKDLLCPLTESEKKYLEEQILKNGCLSALLVEKNTNVLIDGHNRLEICKRLNLPFEVKKIEISERKDIEKWIIGNQLGRRNLTPERQKVYIAQLYRSEKKKAGFEEGHEFKGNQHSNNKNVVRGQNDPAAKSHETAKKIAEQVGKSEKTVRRYDKEVEALEKAGKLKEYTDGTLKKDEVKTIIEQAKPKATKEQNNLKHKLRTKKMCNGLMILTVAISQMDKITKNDEERIQSLNEMIEYCKKRIELNY